MKKLMLLLFICWPLLMLNAQQLHLNDINSTQTTTDSIYVLKSDTSYTTFKNPIQFNSFLQIKVHGLKKLFQIAAKEKKPIILFLEGIEMKGIVPVGMDKSKGVLFFILHRDNISMNQWKIVRLILNDKKKKELVVSIGLDGEVAYPSTLQLSAELSRNSDYFLALLSYTCALIVFSFLVKRSNVLREHRQKDYNGYSLSNTLIAFWVFIILFSIVFLLTAINSFPHITVSVIVLFIISSTSSLVTLIGNDTKYLSKNRNAKSSAIDFLKNIISDAKGINIFRLQLVLFTLLTGGYFIFSVISEMMFPIFDTYYLILFSISHLIYLIFRLLDNKIKL